MMSFSELCRIVDGQRHGPDGEFDGVSIDTRTLKAGDLYIGIRGHNFDGNDFAEAALAAGAAGVMTERRATIDDRPRVLVTDGRESLGRFAAAWRDRWPGKLVGVTGSNGKTTVKEMIAAILAEEGETLRTQGNFNNDIGVPLTLLKLRGGHRFAVVEMGANHPGEITYTSGLARPDVSVITNAGAAHLEGFGSLEGVARAKGELLGPLQPEGIAVLNADDRFFSFWAELARHARVLSFGLSPTADIRAEATDLKLHLDQQGFLSCFDLRYNGKSYPVRMRLAGSHNMVNALAAAAACFALSIEGGKITSGLAKIRPVSGRLRPLRCGNGALIIDDSYNANPSSFSSALDVLLALPGEPWVALGAFGELGPRSAEWHAAIGREAKERGVSRLFVTGMNGERAVAAFGSSASFYDSAEDMIDRLSAELRRDTVMLVKGSRSQHMEKVVQALAATGEDTACC